VLQVEFTISKFGQNYDNANITWEQLRKQGFARLPDARIFRNIRGAR
jgi:hypothetical protein